MQSSKRKPLKPKSLSGHTRRWIEEVRVGEHGWDVSRANARELLQAQAFTDELQSLGQMMSNACYNLAQRETLSPADRESLGGMRRKWDALLASVARTRRPLR